MTKVAFISGHLNLTQDQFTQLYKPAIDTAIELGHHFIVGDADGVDWMAQVYLHNHDILTVTLVWCGSFPTPRNGPYRDEWTLVSTGKTQTDKDRYMTEHSDYDIAFPLRDNSGTMRNIIRRQKMENTK